MATVDDFLNVARRELGTVENPRGSNQVKYATWAGIPGQPWCDAFVSWVAGKAGVDVGGCYVYCPYHVARFREMGIWLGRDVEPKPGDIVVFANKGVACHIGIVEGLNDDGTIITIEGNTSVKSNDNGGAVMRRTRTMGRVGSSWYVFGLARPRFDDEERKEFRNMAECIFFFEDAHEGYPRYSRVWWNHQTGFKYLGCKTSVGSTNFLKKCGLPVVGTKSSEPYIKEALILTNPDAKHTYKDLTVYG